MTPIVCEPLSDCSFYAVLWKGRSGPVVMNYVRWGSYESVERVSSQVKRP